MKVATHPWKPLAGNLDNLQTINTGETVEIDVPIGKHVAWMTESIIYNEHDGTYLMHDEDFAVEPPTKHEKYPLAGECKKHHGSAKGETQTTVGFLLVADEPFTVKLNYMSQDENWGTRDAKILHVVGHSTPVRG